MKYIIALMISIFASSALANSVTVCKDDQLIISSKDIRIVSQDHADVKVSHDCDLKISPDSKVVVKNNGRRIVEETMIAIIVDKEKNYCEVESIFQV